MRGNVLRLTKGLIADCSQYEYPSLLHGWDASGLELADLGTHFGVVYEGRCLIKSVSGTFDVGAGMYFSVPGRVSISGAGQGFVATRTNFVGVFSLGGPIENEGRLRYINGCSDSLLISPVMQGDPCLNMLFLPPHIQQTPHTHPSVRLGLVVSGEGFVHFPGDSSAALVAGSIFILPADVVHYFETSDQTLRVVVYHPDSDFGPTDVDHPMINRTVVVNPENI